MSEIFLRINLDESATAMTANFLRVMKCLLHRNRLIVVVSAEKGAAMGSFQGAGDPPMKAQFAAEECGGSRLRPAGRRSFVSLRAAQRPELEPVDASDSENGAERLQLAAVPGGNALEQFPPALRGMDLDAPSIALVAQPADEPRRFASIDEGYGPVVA
jgi:hypothetical protein